MSNQGQGHRRTYDTTNTMNCSLNGPANSIQHYDAELEANAAAP
jgi:hypothetical protein